tara:strand:+ start:983 stop:1156 length:174 start_codon:yes stop_codon:yes gene_type:complete
MKEILCIIVLAVLLSRGTSAIIIHYDDACRKAIDVESAKNISQMQRIPSSEQLLKLY